MIFPRYTITLKYMNLSEADAASVLAFFNGTARGALSAFRYAWPVAETWVKEYVARGDNAETLFTIPCIGGASVTTTAYINNVQTTKTFHAASGADGLDQIEFSTAPGSGAMITVSFIGRWAPRVRFEDQLGQDLRAYLLYEYGAITFVGCPE
jgi:hypothetical protein